MFVAALIGAVVSGIISALGTIAGTSWFTEWVFGSIGEIVVAPFSALVSIILYLDLRARTEGLTVTALRTVSRERRPRAERGHVHHDEVVVMCYGLTLAPALPRQAMSSSTVWLR